MKKKQNYRSPELELLWLSPHDCITSSVQDPDQGEWDPQPESAIDPNGL